jgi:hypothetical protein
MVGAGGGLIVNVTGLLPVPKALLAWRVTLYVPAVVGVPETAPVVVLTVKPGAGGFGIVL